ncbi:hydrogenase accessory protein [Donghicola sp. C2-DW-16]|uniref:Hydrogenase accessory protein n=1 Tax=Donghicola mangrovi TaxID=2729614 RepID=A0A850Q9C9_9RHOB|nr:hydrogenase accessory protein [Donghicola mangrovi]NVO25514.1 hydrogenase accessory protein [Donghicola mangrovi]NVO29387.1 hydrogenase accessory protein [Donghicola mangrovi]
MTHPLIDRLTSEFSWPHLDSAHDVTEFTARPGVHVLFVPGDAARNLETADVAVILPELKQAFQGRFDCGVVGDAIEQQVREDTKVLKTPSLIFFRDGKMIGGIPRVRDWDEYMARITQILAQTADA